MTVITLCRFVAEGQLCLERKNLDDTTYVAVSHVWGKASGHDFPGVDWKVLASPHKALFIATQLEQLVEGQYFWMDVLAVDQSTKEARASVVRHIPEIYRKARFTLVVREPGGLDGCCYEAFQWPELLDPKSIAETWTSLDNHIRQAHPRGFREVWMERNWPLEELMLSNRVRFTACSAFPEPDEVLPSMPSIPTSVAAVKGWIFTRDLWTMGQRWTGSQSLGDDVERFISAVFLNTELERAPQDNGSTPSVSKLLLSLSDSIRQSGRPQDFVLAIFLQFPWYNVPPNPASKSFGELLGDMLSQLQQSAQDNSIHDAPPEDARIRAKVTEGMLKGFSIDASASYVPAQDVPIPASVGDFVKLFHNPQSRELLPGTAEIFQDLPIPAAVGDFVKLFHNPQSGELLASTAQMFPWTLEYLDLAAEASDFLGILVSTFQSLDLANLQGFTSQWAAWSNDPARLMTLFGEYQPTPSLTWESSQRDLLRSVSTLNSHAQQDAIHATVILANIMRFVCLGVFPGMTGALARRVRDQNPDASGLGAINLQPPGSLDEEWRQLLNNFVEHDSPTFRKTIALLAATISCDLGLSAVPWLRQTLTIYVLKQGHAIPSSRRTTLCFGAPDLDLTRLPAGHTIHAHGDCEPYVVAQNKITMARHVIGLAPPRGSTVQRLLYKGIDKLASWTNIFGGLA